MVSWFGFIKPSLRKNNKSLSRVNWMARIGPSIFLLVFFGGWPLGLFISLSDYRDSITDATNGVGQILMTAVYREQWIFWAATNVFSIYLWWGESLQIQGKYLIYLINSLVDWYQWSKAAKQNRDLPN